MPDEITTCVALLHDVLEDTPVTLAQLERDFPPEVTQAVARLTRPAGMDYFAYVASLKNHPIARLVKQADLAHNSDEGRLAALLPRSGQGCGEIRPGQGHSGGLTPLPGKIFPSPWTGLPLCAILTPEVSKANLKITLEGFPWAPQSLSSSSR